MYSSVFPGKMWIPLFFKGNGLHLDAVLGGQDTDHVKTEHVKSGRFRGHFLGHFLGHLHGTRCGSR